MTEWTNEYITVHLAISKRQTCLSSRYSLRSPGHGKDIDIMKITLFTYSVCIACPIGWDSNNANGQIWLLSYLSSRASDL